MRTTITKRVTLLTLAFFVLGSLKSVATSEVYNFKEKAKAQLNEYTKPTFGDNVANDMQMISLSEDNFSNRFSTGPRSQNSGDNCFKFRNTSNWEGLYSQYSGRYIAVRNLKVGDKIAITMNSSNKALKFSSTSDAVVGVTPGTTTVENGSFYTVAANGNVIFETTGTTIIERVVILSNFTSQKVFIGSPAQEEFDFSSESTGNLLSQSPLVSPDGNMFDNRFSTSDKLTDMTFISGSGLKFLWNGKSITMDNLKAGEKIAVTFTDGDSDCKFKMSGVKEDGAATAITSATEYTVTGTSVTITSNGKNPTISSITIKRSAVTIGGTTLVSAFGLNFTGLAVRAYVATEAENGTVSFTRVNKIPANTPLYLKADEAVGVDVPIIANDFDEIDTNLLKGSASATTSLQSTEDTKYYVFGVMSDEAGFYPVSTSDSFTSAAGKAYLQLTAAQASNARSIRFLFNNDDITGVNEVNMENDNKVSIKKSDLKGVYYTLYGQRVENPTKGIYIVNGKKVVID